MRIPSCVLIVLVVIGSILAAGCTQSTLQKTEPVITPSIRMISATTTITPNVSAQPPGIQPTRDLIKFVDTAVVYARGNGKEKSIADFNDPNGQFAGKDRYIFAGGYDGTVLAEPFEHEIVGKNIPDLSDPYGIPIVRNLIDTARNGKGLVSYHYRNPSMNYTIQPKVSYVVDVDGTYYIGAALNENTGTEFPASGMNVTAKDRTPGELVTFVQDAAGYAKTFGKEKALAAFIDPKGPFINGEMYIIAYDQNATNLAHPYSPWVRGLSLEHYTDQDSVATISELSGVARRGGGFTHTTQRIPSGESVIYAPKLQYVVPVDDRWWVAASILNPDYTKLRSGNLTNVRARDQTEEQLFTLVDRAVRYAKEFGKEKTLAGIGKPDGAFVDGDLVVWAETFDGIILADPVNNDLVGKQFLNYTDPYGEKTTIVGIDAIRNGTGFTHAMFPDAASGSVVQVPKLVYMRQVDDTWWIGSGTYGVQVQLRPTATG
ncbi:MAG: cache domain-containing protein [Methanomicrobiales archaeon]|nr:cache domain-containing protein [Methanomicrobiales archaeon]